MRSESLWCVWKDSVDPVPYLLEFHAVSNLKRKLHWVVVKEVPEVIAKVGLMIGRRVKNSDGQWVAPSTHAHGGKVGVMKQNNMQAKPHKTKTLQRAQK